MEKILHLNLYRKWFIQILNGKKKEEYRDKSPYWKKRLFDDKGKPKKYNFIVFRNGYSKDAPEMKVKFLGIRERDKDFAILLGKILEAKRCQEICVGVRGVNNFKYVRFLDFVW